MQLDAAVVAGGTLYVGEVKRMLGEASVGDLAFKLVWMR